MRKKQRETRLYGKNENEKKLWNEILERRERKTRYTIKRKKSASVWRVSGEEREKNEEARKKKR